MQVTNLPGVKVRDDLEAEFWPHVNKSADGCWEWTSNTRRGYGYLYIGMNSNGRSVVLGTHRLSWLIHCGSIPEGMQVCHHCDNPLCVRPDHLFLGTQRDNMVDMAAKGRHGIKGHAHKAAGDITLTISLDPETDKVLTNLAHQYEGNKSMTIRTLLRNAQDGKRLAQQDQNEGEQ